MNNGSYEKTNSLIGSIYILYGINPYKVLLNNGNLESEYLSYSTVKEIQ